jgi:flagellar biosynthesis/type III secretory pathway protein FliH
MRRSLSEKERKMLSRAARELLDEGRREGVREGEARGQAKALTQVLERRFRVLPAKVRRRIAGAGPGELETWLNRAVDAATLDAVFSPSAKH